MRKIKYREISPEMDRMSKPGTGKNRASIGMEGSIGEYYYIRLTDLLPYHNQARKRFDEEGLENLAASIKEHGVRQPLTVIKASNQQRGKFEVVSGERRMRAAKIAGLEKVPCIIINEEMQAEQVALIENLHREDLHPFELAQGIKTLLEMQIFKTQQEVAQKLSMSKGTVSEILSYLKIHPTLREKIIKDNIQNGALNRKLIKVESPKEQNSIYEQYENSNEIGGFKKKTLLRIREQENKLFFETKRLFSLDIKTKSKIKNELIKIIEQL